jgi:xanthine dehydrogenase YagR molybdenum-binding subunit
VRIHADGSVDLAMGTQDLGSGTKTVVGIVVAETLGLPLEAVTVKIGESKFPPSGGSGGSTTVGGVSSSARVGAVDAANQLFAKVAGELGVAPEQLEARDGVIRVVGEPDKKIAFKDACRAIGPNPIVGRGKEDRSLMNSGVGGVQMAEVEVDVETGVVTVSKVVAVQDCGTIVDLKTAESQVYGGVIMGITSALYEERVLDPITGMVLNPDMEFYRLAGAGDVGEIEVHMMQTERHHQRGVIGLGEPPVISPMAAVANAVANALGVRVPRCPITPREVLLALGKAGA